MENVEQNQQPEIKTEKKNEKWEFIDPNFSMKGFMLFAGIIFLILASTGTYYILKKTRNQIPEGIPCTLEAKICPDGSSVGRTGPKCEFSPCPNIKSSPTESLELLQKNPSETTLTPIPSESTLANWKTYTSPENTYSFKYPSTNWSASKPQNGSLGSYVMVLCDTCTSENIDLFQVVPVIYKSIDEYMTKETVRTDKTTIQFHGLDAVKSAASGGPQAGGSMVSIFVVYKGVGYQIDYRFRNLMNKSKLSDFPNPNPDILSTFKFTD